MLTAYEKSMLRGNAFGHAAKEQWIHMGKEEMAALLPGDPSYQTGVEILGKGKINARFNQYETSGCLPQIKVQASLSKNENVSGNVPFCLGDIFAYDGGYWLCTESRSFHGIYQTGNLEKCNHLLHWQNPITGALVSRQCIIQDLHEKPQNESKLISLGVGKCHIRLPYDTETMQLRKGKRFLIGRSKDQVVPYTLASFGIGIHQETTSKKPQREGILLIFLEEGQLNLAEDHLDLLIANYANPKQLAQNQGGSQNPKSKTKFKSKSTLNLKETGRS